MKKLKPGKTNREERMNFVNYWAEYVKTHSDEDWSKQQKKLIDSQLHSSSEIFKNRFGSGKKFKINARAYLRKLDLI